MQDVKKFLHDLADGMGENVKFKIEKIYHGDEYAAGVTWHLEWKNRPIPFTKGCSFYECAREEDKLVIKNARIVIETPIKPGAFVLKLLKVVTSLFDQFPHLTERILQKPNIVVKFLLKIYKMFIEPMILPVFVYYTHLWTFVARLIGYIIKIIQAILGLFM